MPLPTVGEVHDGYRYNGGDPSSKGAWAWVGDGGSQGKVAGGFDAAAQSQKYQDKIAQARAASDMKRLDGAQEIEAAAYSNEATAARANDVLAADTPTGAFADQRIAAGRAMGGNLAHTLSLGFIPTKDQTANLETMESLGNQGALGSVAQLKGPMSDRDVAFLKSLQYNPGASREQNRRVVEAQGWVSRRQAAYASALRTWTEKLGSPSALNPQGVSFDRWWGQFSAEKLPPPGVRGPAKKVGAPAAPAAKTEGAGWRIVE